MTDFSAPKVSVVTPCHNGAEWLEACYRSLRAQTFEDWEWLIVDDGSSDSSRDILASLETGDQRVKPTRLTKNAGAGVARNAALDAACGDYLAFLDVDDAWLPEKLSRQMTVMDEGAGLSFTAYRVRGPSGTAEGVIDRASPDRATRQDLLMKRVTMGCSTVMARRELVGDKRFPSIRRGQDFLFWLMLLEEAGEAVKVNDVLSEYRITPGSVSRNKFRKAAGQWWMYRRPLGLSLLVSAFYFFHYAKNAVFRK